MRKAMILAAGIAVAALTVSPAAADVSPFVGHWEGINEIPDIPGLGDDSRMIINISNGRDGTVNVFYKDFGATACGTDPDTGEILYGAQSKTTGVIDGNVLSTYGRGGSGVGNGAIWCMANPPFELIPASTEPTPWVTYDPVTDTLFDGFDFYFRVRNN